MKKVFKYGTGEPIPEGAIYLNTIKQTEIFTNIDNKGDESHAFWKKCWLVWHYFLVEVEE